MIAATVALAGAVTVLVVVLLAVTAVGIHGEPPAAGLSTRAHNPVSAAVRHLLGVYVGQPGQVTGAPLAGHVSGPYAEGQGR